MDLIGVGCMKIAIKPTDEQKLNTHKKILPISLLPEKPDIRKVFHQFVNHFPPHLRWVSFFKAGSMTAEVLMSAELIRLQVPTLTIKEVEMNEPLPPEIRPDLRKFRLEATFFGIRGATNLSYFSSGRYKIELSIGELKLSSGFSGKSHKTNLNFLDPYASGYLLLPEQIQFWPPIIIKHLDCSHKHSTVIGAEMIRRPEKFLVKEKPKQIQRFVLSQNTSVDIEAQKSEDVPEYEESQPLLGTKKMSRERIKQVLTNLNLPKFLQLSISSHRISPLTLENEFTWWTKFYNSFRSEEFINNCMQQLTVSYFSRL